MPEEPIALLRGFWSGCGLAERTWPPAAEAFERYRRLIAEHNAAAGLMADGAVGADFFIKHVADSLAVLAVWPELLAGAVRLADVGCGAGLPGIALALALPRLHLTAIESDRRKAAFVADAVAALGLGDRAEVLPRRSRELGQDPHYSGRFDVVTARAVAPAAKLINDCRRLLAPGGSAVFYKTPAAVAEELDLARREAGKHGLSVRTSEPIALPGGAGIRQFIRIIR